MQVLAGKDSFLALFNLHLEYSVQHLENTDPRMY
jgi:hypothetical protein